MTDGAATSPAPDAPDASPTTEGGAGGSVASNLPAPSLAELSKRAADEAASLDGELSEIEMLVAQATTEATRHEARRVQAEEKLTAIAGSIEPPEAGELTQQLVLLTRRSAVMEAQVDVVRGKARALGRYRDTIVDVCRCARVARQRRWLRVGGWCLGARLVLRPTRRHSRGSSCRPRRTCAARSPGRCTTGRPRA